MPGSVVDGALLQLCPDGMTPSEMQALFPTHHHHGHTEDTSVNGGETYSCPLGLTISELYIAADVNPPHIEDLSTSLIAQLAHASMRRVQSVYQPRAPPLLLQS